MLMTNAKVITHLWYVYAFSISLSSFARAQGPTDLETRFLAEAPAAWREYRSFARQLQGTVTFTITTIRKGKKDTETSQYELKQNARCRFFSDRALNPPGKEELWAYNRDYAFTVVRRGGNNPWALTDFVVLDQEKPLSEVKWIDDHFRVAYRLTSLGSEELPDLVEMENFRVLGVTPSMRAGIELARVEFDNSHALEFEGKTGFCPIQKGVMLLDPNQCWCLRFAEVEEKYKSSNVKLTVESELFNSSGKYPIPKRLMDKNESFGVSPAVLMQIEDFDLVEPSSLPKDIEFRLPAFGLQEPGSRGQGIPFHVWLLVAGIALIGIAFLFRGVIKRQEAPKNT